MEMVEVRKYYSGISMGRTLGSCGVKLFKDAMCFLKCENVSTNKKLKNTTIWPLTVIPISKFVFLISKGIQVFLSDRYIQIAH